MTPTVIDVPLGAWPVAAVPVAWQADTRSASEAIPNATREAETLVLT
jgi:hypothetical protein